VWIRYPNLERYFNNYEAKDLPLNLPIIKSLILFTVLRSSDAIFVKSITPELSETRDQVYRPPKADSGLSLVVESLKIFIENLYSMVTDLQSPKRLWRTRIPRDGP